MSMTDRSPSSAILRPGLRQGCGNRGSIFEGIFLEISRLNIFVNYRDYFTFQSLVVIKSMSDDMSRFYDLSVQGSRTELSGKGRIFWGLEQQEQVTINQL